MPNSTNKYYCRKCKRYHREDSVVGRQCKIRIIGDKIRRSNVFEDRLEYDGKMLSKTYGLTLKEGKELKKYLWDIS